MSENHQRGIETRKRRCRRGKIAAAVTAAGLLLVLSGCSKNTAGTVKADKSEDSLSAVKIGCDSYPPYNYLDEDGVAIGIDVELAEEAFSRMGYETEIVYIDWEQKKELVENGEIDCIWGCFSMEGRLDDYRWAGPYMVSKQVVAVKENSEIQKLSDLTGKRVAVQSTTKPDEIFTSKTDERIPPLGNLISVARRELMYTLLAKDYVDAIAAHETSILQYTKDYDIQYRILAEPLMTVGIGAAFAKEDERGICEALDQTLEEMRKDGTAEKIIGKYLENPEKYLEVDQLDY